MILRKQLWKRSQFIQETHKKETSKNICKPYFL